MIGGFHGARTGGVRDRDQGIEDASEIDCSQGKEEEDRNDECELDEGLAARDMAAVGRSTG